MLVDIITKGAANRSVLLRIIDSTDGSPETGVLFNTAGIDLWYRREGEARVAITEASLSALTDAHSDGGVLHVGDGYYRLDLPDAAFATAANYVDFGGTVTGMIVIGGRVKLVDANFEDGVRLGLTALPNAAAEAAGGLYTRGSGAGQIDQAANGQINANAVAISGDAAAADNLETMLDGTGGATLSLGQLNVVNASGSAIVATSSGGNGHGLVASGHGTGSGLVGVGGATNAHGMYLLGQGAGDGLRGQGTGAGGSGLTGLGNGSGRGAQFLGGATGHGFAAQGGSGGTQNHGIYGKGGDNVGDNGSGIKGDGGDVGWGIGGLGGPNGSGGIRGSATVASAAGIEGQGGASAAGIIGRGGASGHGIHALAGASAGSGARFEAQAASAAGAEFIAGTGGLDIDGNLGGNVSGSVGSVAAGGITAASFGAGAIDSAALNANAIDEMFDEQIGDSTVTMRQALKLMVAVLGGKVSGAGTSTITFRNVADTVDVVVATVDGGNRTAITLTL